MTVGLPSSPCSCRLCISRKCSDRKTAEQSVQAASVRPCSFTLWSVDLSRWQRCRRSSLKFSELHEVKGGILGILQKIRSSVIFFQLDFHFHHLEQTCGSVSFWCGHWCGFLPLYRGRIREARKHRYGSGTLVHSHHSSKRKSHKEFTKQYRRNQGFSCYFCLMMIRSGSVLVTNGSGCGSGRRKNIGYGSGSATLPLRWVRFEFEPVCN